MTSVLFNDFRGNYGKRHKREKTTKFSIGKDRPGYEFRVFVPPGLTWCMVAAKAGRDARIGMAARIDLPPWRQYDLRADYDSLPWTSPNEISSFSQFVGHDVQVKNRGGTTTVIQASFSPPVKKGKWLFLKTLSYDGSRLGRLQIDFFVDTKIYYDWYSTVVLDPRGQPPYTPRKSNERGDRRWPLPGGAVKTMKTARVEDGKAKKEKLLSAFERIKNMRA